MITIEKCGIKDEAIQDIISKLKHIDVDKVKKAVIKYNTFETVLVFNTGYNDKDEIVIENKKIEFRFYSKYIKTADYFVCDILASEKTYNHLVKHIEYLMNN